MGVVNLNNFAVLVCVLTSLTFSGKKCTLAQKILATPSSTCVLRSVWFSQVCYQRNGMVRSSGAPLVVLRWTRFRHFGLSDIDYWPNRRAAASVENVVSTDHLMRQPSSRRKKPLSTGLLGTGPGESLDANLFRPRLPQTALPQTQ